MSARAAETIWSRLVALHSEGRRISPADILAAPDEQLRSVGMSAAKVMYIKDLAARVANGSLRLDRLSRWPNERIVSELVVVNGIGRWTAEMFLIFKLGRPDVWPVDDLGIRNAVRRAYGVEPTVRVLHDLAEPWRPWRSAASWYLWRSLALETV